MCHGSSLGAPYLSTPSKPLQGEHTLLLLLFLEFFSGIYWPTKLQQSLLRPFLKQQSEFRSWSGAGIVPGRGVEGSEPVTAEPGSAAQLRLTKPNLLVLTLK